MPRIFAHRNRAVLPWIWIREIAEHMILWGKECWWKQRRLKIHGKIRQHWQRLGSPFAGRVLQDMNSVLSGKKTPVLPKEELKSPGRKCSQWRATSSQRGRNTQRETKSCLQFFGVCIQTTPFQPVCHSQCHSSCAGLILAVGDQSAGDTKAVGWLCPHLPGHPVHKVTHSCCCSRCSLAEAAVP